MEGAVVYRDVDNQPILVLYKEYTAEKVLYLLYKNKKLYKTYISLRKLTTLLPVNSIHILTKLPFSRDMNTMLNMWKNLVKVKLEEI